MNKVKIILFLLLFVVLAIGCSNNSENTETKSNRTESENSEEMNLTISAAASLTDALDEIKSIYEKENQVKLTFNFGGSGSLAQQIQQGAPADVFISANQDWMDTLEEEEKIIVDTRSDITGNNLVLITGKSSTLDYEKVEDMNDKDVEQIAIGNPESVPAGKYTEQSLKNMKIWDKLEDSIILAKDVRQVLTYVETGNVDIGFVYESDAETSDKINKLTTVDKDVHDPIIYPGAVIADTEHEQEAKDFLNYMETDQAQEILEKYGFQK
ncbi:molybdate ABC transporter substrate-binding protein [Virgibacillus alimentarius]|uniref:Molybdate transport system substrate-binding protein n=1 Tax=Virgibacillus alimentarius TaxID=698769 RepID=A0ABS4SA52_9BACI|nr:MULTISPECIES: molybdate ABC transporter substrate-binding protein [Virgibacillus]MBP2258389.1 molybdate transport system substrate-binding protein [Virgibacillus alimentarius]HLR67646.1 molybdate ABC transporter substrate-binding protein [Virgibacillus sp.]